MVLWNGKTGRGSLVAGGIASVLASTCCLSAPVLAGLGFGGASAAHLTALEPYRPVFIGAALIALFFAYRTIFRRPQTCHPEARAAPQTRHKVVFWIVATLLGIGVALEGVEKGGAALENKESAPTSSGAPTSTGKNAGARRRMPDLTFVDLDGRPWRLSGDRGHVVLMNFWASWCPPCRKEMPMLVRLSNGYRSRGLDVVGVMMDEGGLERVRQFLREYQVSYRILLPGSAVRLMPPVERLPTTFLVDKQGQLAAVYSGAIEEGVFRQDLEKLLAER